MPTYTIRNKETEESFDIFCTYPELQEILENDNNLIHMLSAPAIVGDHVVNRMDGGMKETFSRIAEAHPNSPLADRFGSSQNNKQKKIQELGKKHGLVRKDGGQNMSKVKL
tara:strand:- start:592 stop:924 length:333 start_codon:yes stop_codon:yes gene_type:complete